MKLTDGQAAVALLRLADVQGQLDRLRVERDELICLLDDSVGVRPLARHLGLSPAQVSRIRQKGVRTAPAASQGGV